MRLAGATWAQVGDAVGIEERVAPARSSTVVELIDRLDTATGQPGARMVPTRR